MGNVLRRNGILAAPKRKPEVAWADFIKALQEVRAACDFFTSEVITGGQLLTYYVLFVIQISSRKVHIAGITLNPDGQWMKQIARNLTMVDWGFLSGQKYLIHDRDSKFCEAFRSILKAGGVKPIRLPAKSPNLNSYSGRFVRYIKDECLYKLIFFGEKTLRSALTQFVAHYHEERNHQGKGNVLLFPSRAPAPNPKTSEIKCRLRIPVKVSTHSGF